jgi:hypothetical protein
MEFTSNVATSSVDNKRMRVENTMGANQAKNVSPTEKDSNIIPSIRVSEKITISRKSRDVAGFLRTIENPATVKQLDIYNNNLNDSDLSIFKGVRSVNLHNVKGLTQDNISQLAELPLSFIRISETEVPSNLDLSPLQASPLSTVSLINSNITPAQFDQLPLEQILSVSIQNEKESLYFDYSKMEKLDSFSSLRQLTKEQSGQLSARLTKIWLVEPLESLSRFMDVSDVTLSTSSSELVAERISELPKIQLEKLTILGKVNLEDVDFTRFSRLRKLSCTEGALSKGKITALNAKAVTVKLHASFYLSRHQK